MTTHRLRKEKISIQIIGQQRFWVGVIAGIVSALFISLAFNYSREIFRFITTTSADLLTLTGDELQFFNFFFAILSTVLGLSISIWIWMSNLTHKRKKDLVYKQLSRTNILLIFWVILMVIARFGSIFQGALFGMPGYDGQLNLLEEFWLLFVLIPLVVFLQSWFAVRLVYRSGKWIVISFVVCLFSAYFLYLTTTVNQEKLNHAYYQQFEKYDQFIDKELADAQNEYGIEVKPEVRDSLKDLYSKCSIKPLINLQYAFMNNSSVSMDTIILQKMVIRSFKEELWCYHRDNSIKDLYYRLPRGVLKQINLSKSNKDKTKELFQILKEQIDLVNDPGINWEEFPFLYHLEEVRDSLMKVDEYKEYTRELPEIRYLNNKAP